MEIPAVSLVVAVKNRDENLKRSLDQVALQRARHLLEVVVVNYGGSDSARLICQAADLNIQYVPVNGRDEWNEACAKNIGIRRSKGDLIAVMNADILLPPGFIDGLAEVNAADKGRFLYLARRIDMNADGTVLVWNKPGEAPGDFQATIRANWMLVRGFDQRMRGWGVLDDDLIKRMRRAGINAKCLEDRFSISHVAHPEQKRNIGMADTNRVLSIFNSSFSVNDENWGTEESIPRREGFLAKNARLVLYRLVHLAFVLWRMLKLGPTLRSLGIPVRQEKIDV